jgi:hypothetical protein
MKKQFLFVATALLMGGYTASLKAQNDITSIFKAGVTDLNTVANGYLKPAGTGLAAGLGSNWYNTAAVHKTWGFDLTIGASVAMTPTSDQSFDISGLTQLKPTIAGTTQAPTFAGSGNGVELNLMQPHYLADGTTVNPLWDNGKGTITSFNLKGASKYIPAPTIQFTIGLPIINDVSIRWMPTVKASDAEVSLWGVGVKHDFKKWIPGLKLLPFDASVLVAYTEMNANYYFPASAQITPDKLVSGGLDYVADPNLNDYTTQSMKVNAKSFTAGVIVSKKLAIFTPYVGVGIIKTNFDAALAGDYPTLGDPVLSNGTYKMKIKNIADPVKVTSAETMPNATIGFRLKLALITLHAQYVAQKYPIASAGFGISFR